MPLPRSSSRIQPATLSRKYRSCVTAMTVPLYDSRNRSSHATDSASRWFVGSSRRSRSGAERSSRQSATRRRSPPESVVTSRSPSGRRSASIARSSVWSRLHASARSICSCTAACSASSASKSASGSAKAAEIALKRSRTSRSSRTPSSTFARTSFAGSSSGSCGRKPTVAFGSSSATPEDGSSSPAMIRSSVDLPAPFGPSTPIFAPWRNDSEMFDSTCRSGP